jgi:hypothetical protein
MAKGKGKTRSSGSGSPSFNSGGSGGSSLSQRAIPGPASTGGPVSLKKALAKKAPRGKGI